MEPIEAQLQASWESIHPTCKRIPREAWQSYGAAVTVTREGESTVLAISVDDGDLLTLRLNEEQAVAMIEQLQA